MVLLTIGLKLERNGMEEISDSPRVTGLMPQAGVMAKGGSADDAYDWSKAGYRREFNEETNEWEYIEDKINGAKQDGWARRTFRKEDGKTDYQAWVRFMDDQPFKREKEIGFWVRRGLDEDGVPDGTWIRKKQNPILQEGFERSSY